ncbi:MAG: phosphoglycolate phosphatase [Rhodospirillales bacterium]|nr:phosphoglycolate phosphatase [Rhodospirillales bacterium]
MSTITCVVFDLDGTLIDSAPDLHGALNIVLTELGKRPLSLAEVESIVGDGAAMLVRKALALVAAVPLEAVDDDTVATLTPPFLAAYGERAVELTRAYDGVSATLDALAADGMVLAVCTNKPEALTRHILAHLGLARYFGAVIGGDSLNGIRKPDPRHLLAAVTAIGGTPAQTAMVGDSINDVAAARAAGVPVIVRAGGYSRVPAEQLGADAIIGDFAELPAAIVRLT